MEALQGQQDSNTDLENEMSESQPSERPSDLAQGGINFLYQPRSWGGGLEFRARGNPSLHLEYLILFYKNAIKLVIPKLKGKGTTSKHVQHR